MTRNRFIKLGMSMGFPKRYMQVQADWIQCWHYNYEDALESWFINNKLLRPNAYYNKGWKNTKMIKELMK